VHIKEKDLLDRILEIITNYLLEERLFNVAYQKTKREPEYDNIEKMLVSLSDRIKNKMGSELDVFMQYEELSTLGENCLLRDSYKQGFIDGSELLRDISNNKAI
jgi:hypothetical protein